VNVGIRDSVINEATSAVLRGVMEESGLQQKSWASASGLSLTVVQKLLSGNQSVKVPQLLALAHSSKLSADEIMERIDKAVARAVSEMPVSLDAHRAKKPADMSNEEIDELAGAAVHDIENEGDEPAAP
jgi:transcriptional regulator with XRE-family HTH domain